LLLCAADALDAPTADLAFLADLAVESALASVGRRGARGL